MSNRLLSKMPLAQVLVALVAVAWTAFDRDRIRSLVSHGRTLFVDVTADWCLICPVAGART